LVLTNQNWNQQFLPTSAGTHPTLPWQAGHLIELFVKMLKVSKKNKIKKQIKKNIYIYGENFFLMKPNSKSFQIVIQILVF
jgi:hypothetical protein